MIEHFHPRVPPAPVKGKATLDREFLERASSDAVVPVDFAPGARIFANFNAVASDGWFKARKVSNNQRGALFEFCIYDSLIHYGISPSNVRVAVDLSQGCCADADLLITTEHGDVALLAKTSLRERWKQLDRDAMVMTTGRSDLRVWGIIISESPDQTAAAAISHLQAIESKCAAKITVRTIHDEDSMRELFTTCGATG